MKKRVGLAIISCIVAAMVCVFGTLSICADTSFIIKPSEAFYDSESIYPYNIQNNSARALWSLSTNGVTYEDTYIYPTWGDVINRTINGYELAITTDSYDLTSYEKAKSINFVYDPWLIFNAKASFVNYIEMYVAINYYTPNEDLSSYSLPWGFTLTVDEYNNLGPTGRTDIVFNSEVWGRGRRGTNNQSWTTIYRLTWTSDQPVYIGGWYNSWWPEDYQFTAFTLNPAGFEVPSYIDFGIVGGYVGTSVSYFWGWDNSSIDWDAVSKGIPPIDLLFNPIGEESPSAVIDLSNVVWSMPLISTILIPCFGLLATWLVIKLFIRKGS